MQWYIAGPMTGYPHFNFPRFVEVADALRGWGYEVVSPAELDDPEDFKLAMMSSCGVQAEVRKTWGQFLGRDVEVIADKVDGLVLMDNWWESKGALLEATAGLLTGKKFRSFYTGKDGVHHTQDVVATAVAGIVYDNIVDKEAV